MSSQRVQRRLSAILAADVVGYSRLMAADERGTYERLKGIRREIVDPVITEHAGRIVKLMGDGLLAEFPSAVDAVECAIAIQRGLAASNAERADARPIELRIGINLGDVLVEDRDIFGDGVNIAARLEAEASPGGICISEDVHRYVRNNVEVVFEDLGERRLKNIAMPVRVFEARPAGPPASGGGPAPPRAVAEVPPDKPSVVVLPFDNMSGDPEQAYFSDGIAEDIITDLSKVSGLFVIARNSAFTYRGRALDLRQVCRELGVRHALEGSVRKAGNRVRITAQLIDGATGGHLWAERYDRDLTDIFEVQDEVTREIVAALQVQLTPEESRRVAARGTASIEAYEWFLQGRELVWRHRPESGSPARQMFARALALDADFAAAHAGVAFSHVLDYINRWSDVPEASLQAAGETAETAVGLDDNEPLAHFVLGIVRLWHKDLPGAEIEARRTVALDPNFADAHTLLGQAMYYAGRPAEALAQYDRVARLDPHYSSLLLMFRGQALIALGRYEDAIDVLRRRLIREPSSDVSRVLLASAYGHVGRAEEARAEWGEALRLNPAYSIEDRRKVLPFADPADFEVVVEGLRKADIPI